MKKRHPSRFATLLLERLGPENDALTGDLAEECRARSALWFWGQTLSAIAVHFVTDARAHWVVGLRAILTGMLLLKVLALTVGPVVGVGLDRWARYVDAPAHIFMQLQIHSLVLAFVWFFACVGAGRVVARWHHRHLAVAIIGLMTTLVAFMLTDSRLYFLIGNSLTHQRFWPYLMTYLLHNFATLSGLLIGGLTRSTDHWRDSRRVADKGPRIALP